jgi:hypothetical protein
MAFFAAITMVLTVMSNIKVVAPDDQWSSMALGFLRSQGMTEVSLDMAETVSKMIVFHSRLDKWGQQHRGISSWWCSWTPSLDFAGENARSNFRWLYLTMTDLYIHLLVEDIVCSLVRLSLGETFDL